MNRLCLALSALAAASLQLACATPATPPEASPVYGDVLNPQVKPISVEAASLNDPESRTIGETSAPMETAPKDAAAAKEAPPDAPAQEAGQASPTNPTPDAAKATPAAPHPPANP